MFSEQLSYSVLSILSFLGTLSFTIIKVISKVLERIYVIQRCIQNPVKHASVIPQKMLWRSVQEAPPSLHFLKDSTNCNVLENPEDKYVKQHFQLKYSSVPNKRTLPLIFLSKKFPTPSTHPHKESPPLISFSLFLRKTWKRIALLHSKDFDWNVQTVLYFWTSSITVNVQMLFTKNKHCK